MPTELYTTNWCSHCAAARDELAWRGEPFVEYDIEQDRAAFRRMIELTGGQQDHWLTLEAVLQAARADPRAVEARLRAFVAAQPPERFTAFWRSLPRTFATPSSAGNDRLPGPRTSSWAFGSARNACCNLAESTRPSRSLPCRFDFSDRAVRSGSKFLWPIPAHSTSGSERARAASAR